MKTNMAVVHCCVIRRSRHSNLLYPGMVGSRVPATLGAGPGDRRLVTRPTSIAEARPALSAASDSSAARSLGSWTSLDWTKSVSCVLVFSFTISPRSIAISRSESSWEPAMLGGRRGRCVPREAHRDPRRLCRRGTAVSGEWTRRPRTARPLSERTASPRRHRRWHPRQRPLACWRWTPNRWTLGCPRTA